MNELPRKLRGLHILLNCVERHESRKVMAQLLNVSNTAIGKKLSTLKQKGYIEQITSRPIAAYKILPLGLQVNQIIAQSDGAMSGFYKCHHKIVGYKIENYGTWRFNEKIWKTMKGNWHWQKVKLKDYNIRIQDTGKMIIICPKIYDKQPSHAFGKMIEDAQEVGRQLAQKYNMKLGDFIEVREGHKELIGSNQIAEMIGYLKIGNFWIDESGGSRNFEELETSDKMERLLDLPDVIGNKLVPAIEQHSHDILLHLAVLKEIRDAVKELSEAVKKKK